MVVQCIPNLRVVTEFVCESKFFVNTERIMMKSHESAESGNRRTIFTIG
ncbi:hypothetical protein T05_2832 [Trichinella murrelli]|uniref:Uncharacterized protein n=1 Tax=Trichinella murrelli TaxID=144512 RepID=A0A0V0TLN1_9BILA|nr:hypothetical protein T05_2832 [Trichinella murrelli]